MNCRVWLCHKKIIITLLVSLLVVLVSDFVIAGDVPANAYLIDNQWYCNNGYRRKGNSCVKFAVPDNAYVYGSIWMCNQGYKKVGNACYKMTPQEAELQRLQILTAQARERSEGFMVDDERFTLSEIERKCEVYRYSENYGDVECSGSKLRIVERKCEAYFSGKFETEGELECNGNDLRPIERYCTTSMYSNNYAEIDC